MSLAQTPLNARHRELGAKMVDFGGWDMPLHYGSQIDEHHIVRRSAGMFDVSHMTVVDLHGDGCRAFLRHLVANNVDKLKVSGKALYTCMLNEQGGVIDDLIVYYMREDYFRLVVNAATREKDLAWINRHAPAHGVSVTQRADLAMVAVQGPQAREAVLSLLPEGDRARVAALGRFAAAEAGDLFIARTGYTGEDGFEVIVPAARVVDYWNALLGAGVKPCGLGARDTLRLEAGMNLYGQDMDETVSPLDAGLAWTVAIKDARDFVGKSALTAAGQQKQFLGLVLLDKGVLRGHQQVITKQGNGAITSGSFSPTLQQSIALARLPLGARIGDEVEVDIRGKLLKAKVVKPVFARNGKSVI